MDIYVEIIDAVPIEVEISGANMMLPTDYFYLFSPDGSTWKLTITNDGNIEREKIV